MNAHVRFRDLKIDSATDDALWELEGVLNRVKALANAGDLVVEHQLGAEAPANTLQVLFSQIEDLCDAAEAMLRRAGGAS